MADAKPAGFVPRKPTAERIGQIAEWNGTLEKSDPETILRWAIETFGSKLTMGTALGLSGCLILSILAKIKGETGKAVGIFNLDTGYQFPETLDLLDRLNAKYGLGIVRMSAAQSVAEYEAANGGAVHCTDSNRCCYDRKISVLEAIAPNYDAWISGLRRDQGPTRANTPVVGWDARFGLVKIAPLAFWTNRDVWRRIVDEYVPYNPLYDQGYASIGCAPCTRAVLPGEDERAGRWSGQVKTECGLHIVNESLTAAQL